MGSAWARPAFARYRACITDAPTTPARLGLCSWSLRARSPEQLAEVASTCEVRGVQLHLDPIRTGDWDLEQTRDALGQRGLTILSAMMTTRDEDYSTLESIARTGGIRPDATWDENLDAARANAEIALALGLDLITFHAGFLPERSDPERATITRRLDQIADVFNARGVRVALETGQESPEELLALLEELDRDDLGVNFDPANMILYASGDPVASLEALAGRVMQIHIKDADPTSTPGAWGVERPMGEGNVDWEAFFGVVQAHLRGVDLLIERESGENRAGDILAAARRVRAMAPSLVS